MKIELKSCNRNQSKHRQCSKDLEAKKRLDLKKKRYKQKSKSGIKKRWSDTRTSRIS